MRRVAFAVAAALVMGGVVVARAADADCPQAVLDVRGANPSYATIAGYLDDAAEAWDIPPQVLKAIAYQESAWKPFRADGRPKISDDDLCGIGLMQITLGSRTDGVQLARDVEYNAMEGAEILDAKWDELQAQTHAYPTGGQPDDRHVVENWYAAICRYNGCSGAGADKLYAEPVARTVRSPFQMGVTGSIMTYLPPVGFTTPKDADPSYAFPWGFQAQHDPVQQLVFFDPDTGTVSKTVAAPTHLGSDTPDPAYPLGSFGPNAPGASCVDCEFWRPYPDDGVAGWPHWTSSVTGADLAKAYWAPPRTGLYDVRVAVADVPDTLGAVTYHAGPVSKTVDQEESKGFGYVLLGRWQLSPAEPLWLGDHSDVAGRKIVADAANLSAVSTLGLTASAGTITYGGGSTLTMRLTQQGGGAPLAGRGVTLWKRPTGILSWTKVGTYVTGATGAVSLVAHPSSNAYYKATFGGNVDTVAATDAIVRVNVRPKVTAALSRTSAPRGTSVKISAAVSPNHAGQKVVLQRYYSGAWHDALSATLSSSSTASWTFAKSTAGTYKYRVLKAPDSDHVTGTSVTLTLTVT